MDIKIHIPKLIKEGKLIFNDIHLTIPKGEWTCFLGTSGIGKTTFLRCLAGLEKDYTDPSLTGLVSYMAQDDLLLPWAKVIDNVLLGARLRGEKPDEKKAHEFLKQVGLQAETFWYPYQLSVGMRQRVALARTLMENKPIILLDEPFSALDAVTRHQIQTLSWEALKGKTVLFVTHDPLEALRLGHRIFFFQSTLPHIVEPFKLETPPLRDLTDPTFASLQEKILSFLTLTKHT